VAAFDAVADVDVPQVPIVDLITLRSGSKEDQVTENEIYYAQYNWRLVKLYRLEPDRRKELCTLLVSLTKKLAPDLKGSEAYKLWEKVAKDPQYPDKIFDSRDME
jgi:hypothetical protein